MPDSACILALKAKMPFVFDITSTIKILSCQPNKTLKQQLTHTMAKKMIAGSPALANQNVLDWIQPQATEPTDKAFSATDLPIDLPQAVQEGAFSPSTEKIEWVRKTYIMRTDHIERLEHVAFFAKRNLKDVLAEALDQYFSRLDAQP